MAVEVHHQCGCNNIFSKTVALGKHKNVAVTSTKAEASKGRYSVFAASVKVLEPSLCCFVVTGAPNESVPTVMDDENSDDGSTESMMMSNTAESEDEDVQPEQIGFEENPNMSGVLVENDKPLSSDKDEI
jgi:hypothetical protein